MKEKERLSVEKNLLRKCFIEIPPYKFIITEGNEKRYEFLHIFNNNIQQVC
jgi:hypothetical protein